jgi:hypothetical protein
MEMAVGFLDLVQVLQLWRLSEQELFYHDVMDEALDLS